MAEDFADGGWQERDPTEQLAEEIENKRAQQEAMERRARLEEALSRVRTLEGKLAEAEAQSVEWNSAVEDLHATFIQAAIDWLAEKWGPSRQCPYCGNDEWTVSVPVNLLLESRETLPPHFTSTCTNCGNTVFINAIQAGLFPDPEL